MDRRGGRAGAGDGAGRHRQLIAALLVFAACASNPQNQAPPIGVELALLDSPANILYFPGPVNLRFELTLTNPTDETVTLRRLDLRTVSSTFLYLRATGTPFHIEVKPHATASVTTAVWANSRGGQLAQDEPISLQATAYFDSPKGAFVRLVSSILSPR